MVINWKKRSTNCIGYNIRFKDEDQGKRFLERINNPDKHWKFSSNDIEGRKYWTAYQDAYEQAIKSTSTKMAPWFIIPADDKLLAHFLIAKIILEKLINMNPNFPSKTKQEQDYMNKAKMNLILEIKP